MQPMISVVIPTFERPVLVQRAVQSAFAQTFNPIEVIVVIDGQDSVTHAALSSIDDPRLRILMLPHQVGGAGARNAGVEAAIGQWIALLDDDDEWMPEKLSLQLSAAQHSQVQFPIVSCRLIARTPTQTYIRPRRIWSKPEPLSNYLLARNSLFQGEGLIQTSTLFVPRSLLLSCPFNPALKRHQDWDWLLRAFQLEGVGFECVDQPLAIWSLEEGRKTVSTTSHWRYSRQWIRDHHPVVTRRAYASFLMVEVSHQAAREQAWLHSFPILAEAIVRGSPTLSDFVLFLSVWFVPQPLRQRLRDTIARFRLNVAFLKT